MSNSSKNEKQIKMDENNNIVCDEVKWIGQVEKENMISNAIAEILKLIQFEDIRVYNNIISKIIGDESFEQSRIEVQRKANSKDKSIPDILIKQNLEKQINEKLK